MVIQNGSSDILSLEPILYFESSSLIHCKLNFR